MSSLLDLSGQDDYRAIVLAETMHHEHAKPFAVLCSSVSALVINPGKWPQATQILQEVPFAAAYAFRCHEAGEKEEKVEQGTDGQGAATNEDYPKEYVRVLHGDLSLSTATVAYIFSSRIRSLQCMTIAKRIIRKQALAANARLTALDCRLIADIDRIIVVSLGLILS